MVAQSSHQRRVGGEVGRPFVHTRELKLELRMFFEERATSGFVFRSYNSSARADSSAAIDK